MRRLLFRYHRWRYQREMARPVPPPRAPRNGRFVRAWRRFRHPVAYVRHRREVRDALAPAPPPPTEADLRGGPIVRRYRHFRVRLSHIRHGFTDWPIAAQIVSCLVVSGLLVGGFIGVKGAFFKKTKPNIAAALAQAAADIQNQIPGKKAGQHRMLVAGDSSAINLATALGQVYETDQYEGLLISAFGCSISSAASVVRDKVQPYPSFCKGWPAAYADNTRLFAPDVSVLMEGSGDALPLVVGGITLRPGTAAFERYMFGRLDVARASLGGTKHPFVLVTPLCTLSPTGRANFLAAPVAAIWSDYARSRTGVTVLNPSSLVCPSGRPGRLPNGKPVVDQHGAFTKEGAAAMWSLLFGAAQTAHS